MLSYLRYFQARYFNERGQGIIEYAVIVAIVVALGLTLAGTGGFKESVSALYTKLITDINTL